MKSRMIVFASLASLALAFPAFAQQVNPATFVGKAGDCGTGYAAGSRIVTAAWLTGLGLPDNGGLNSNPVDPTNNPSKANPHSGLLVSKNGPTADCSSSGANITKVKGITLTEIGFDIRNGSHCSGGSPRFDVQASDGFHFLGGCGNGTQTPAPQDPQWTRVRIDPTNPSQSFPVIAAGATIQSISITFDEGTDTTGGMPGLAVLDNIDINGVLVGAGKPGENGKGGN